MFLAIKNGAVVEWSNNIDSLLGLDLEVIEWDGSLPPYDVESGLPRPDPRTTLQKKQDTQTAYRKNRRREYLSLQDQLDMIYWDAVQETTVWRDEITRVKELFPKPE